MPAPALPPAPYAYVVEYRALDKCFTPSCAFRSRDVFGWQSELQPDGEPGANIQFGKHGNEFWELFFHRGRVMPAGASTSFELPESKSASELDVYFSAEEEEHDFHAAIVFEEVFTAAPPKVVDTREVNGRTESVPRPLVAAQYAHESKAFKHVRVPIPSRDGHTIRVTIKNTGSEGLGLGDPLVMKRVEGRGPRQALWVMYDAVPYPLWDGLLRGPTHDPATEWLHEYVAKNGTYFPNGLTPGLLTTCFSRRTLRGDYFNEVGEPMISRTYSQPPPEITKNVIASLGEKGVQTFAFMANFSILPAFSYLGWDGGYDTEQPDHPYAVASRYKDWVAEHPNDDAFVMWWIASTHLPWPPTRPVSAPAPLPPGLAKSNYNPNVLPETWANALQATDYLKDMLATARAASPDASRMMYISADHGRGFTMRHENRAFRSPITGPWGGGMSHGVGADAEEMKAPFAVVYEGPNVKPNDQPHIVNDDVSIVATLRAVERFFDLSFDLPDTRSFDSPAFTSQASFESRWDDDVIAGIGVAHAYRFVRGNWAYSTHEQRLELFSFWDRAGPIQMMLMGTPYRSGRIMSEELYDRTKDPFETNNVASQNMSTLLDLRRRTTDWLATYYGDESHARYRYTLTFPEKVTVTIVAPRPFLAWADGKEAPMQTPRSVEVTGTRIELQEISDTVGVIEVRGAFAGKPITLRCAENGLPVDATSATRPRLNLALGRTNCPVPRTERVSATEGSIMFSFERARATAGGGRRTSPREAGSIRTSSWPA
jgi:hypothetical protein